MVILDLRIIGVHEMIMLYYRKELKKGRQIIIKYKKLKWIHFIEKKKHFLYAQYLSHLYVS